MNEVSEGTDKVCDVIGGPFVRTPYSRTAPANSCHRGLLNNRLSLKFRTIVLIYIYMIFVQQKDIDGSLSPPIKDFTQGQKHK